MPKLPGHLTALNYLGASDKAMKLSFFPILMRALGNCPMNFTALCHLVFMQFPLLANL